MYTEVSALLRLHNSHCLEKVSDNQRLPLPFEFWTWCLPITALVMKILVFNALPFACPLPYSSCPCIYLPVMVHMLESENRVEEKVEFGPDKQFTPSPVASTFRRAECAAPRGALRPIASSPPVHGLALPPDDRKKENTGSPSGIMETSIRLLLKGSSTIWLVS